MVVCEVTFMLPEEKARQKIDQQLARAGWNIVNRDEYLPDSTAVVREALMLGNKESDYLFFIEGKAVAVLEAKREDNPLGNEVWAQAENYAHTPKSWYGLWYHKLIPLVYLANGKKILFKNLLETGSDPIDAAPIEELRTMHRPKDMLRLIHKTSVYGALPYLDKVALHLRNCQYEAENNFENNLRRGEKRGLAILATGSGKTYLACLASYRLLNYTDVRRILFLVDRNNLGRQAASEFSRFDKTENGQTLSQLYAVSRLRRNDDIKSDIVISTIQKLFQVLIGQKITETSEDAEDEFDNNAYTDDGPDVKLKDHLELPPDYFQFIIVDECHRSIYGKWKAVLDYFRDAMILGLTATPTDDAYAFFNNTKVAEYDYDASVADGVNVPKRIYRIKTNITENGGTIKDHSKFKETTIRTGKTAQKVAEQDMGYGKEDLDRSVITPDQIRKVLTAYRDAIYTDLYPERKADYAYIPKTLIFAKDDRHATKIVEIAKEVFGEKFDGGQVPEHYVQKITYSAGDSDDLIRDFRTERDFRIAVTVTLVATGTDVKPLEVVLFMTDVRSDVLYTQMKGRGCRTIPDDILREVTPNAERKDCFYIVDAVGVTESEKHIPQNTNTYYRRMSLEMLLERLSHGDLSDENLLLLRDYCATIEHRYENSVLFGRHLDEFIEDFGFSPRMIAGKINKAFEEGGLPIFLSPSEDNKIRRKLIDRLVGNLSARKKLLELQRGYVVETDEKDTVTYAGFSKETARSYIEHFEAYINEHRDDIEALRILYNSEDVIITHSMLYDLQEKLLSEDSQYSAFWLWKNYKILDEANAVEELDTKTNVKALTNLMQIVRFAYGKNVKLVSLLNGYTQRFNLYCGQAQRTLTEEQQAIMRRIATYIVEDGSINARELNDALPDLWREGIQAFGNITKLDSEMNTMSRFILKIA